VKFIADQAIPFAREAFSSLGDVQLLPSALITAATVADADGLLVRTTVKVTRDLLSRSRIRFVGTATIGTDHIDIPYIESAGILLASAPGCNATAVGEYVLAAMLALERRKGVQLDQRTLGIIGAGNTGRATQQKAEAMGMRCLLNDPPLARRARGSAFMALEDLLHEADILSIHVPLQRDGEFPTYHLIDGQLLQRVKPGTILINTSRGETVDGGALKRFRHRLEAVVLDVWENEPDIDPELIPLVDIATPHIAGYSIEGKIRATEMIYATACQWLRREPSWSAAAALKERGLPQLAIEPGSYAIHDAVGRATAILEDDERLRLYAQVDNPGAYFAHLRNHYRFRREFSAFQITQAPALTETEKELFRKTGFNIPDG